MPRAAHSDKPSLLVLVASWVRESLADEVEEVQEVGKRILPCLEKLNNVQDDDPGLHKVHLRSHIFIYLPPPPVPAAPPPPPLFEQTGSPDQLLPDSLTQDHLKSEPVCLGKFVLIFIFCNFPNFLTFSTCLGQLKGGVAIEEGKHLLDQLRAVPELLLRFTRHAL